MKPVIALVGRPNVGKSTLFNRLTRTRDALVADYSGLTRDRKYGNGSYEGVDYILIDTGGLSGEDVGIDAEMANQSLLAIEEADYLFFVVDGRNGLNPGDEAIANHLRRQHKPVVLVVNKTDGIDPEVAMSEFYGLGFENLLPTAASHGRGIQKLMDMALADFPPTEEEPEHDGKGTRIGVIGRPNVGKSTLVNRMLGEERVVVFDMPGTTRDSIYIDYERNEKPYTIIDTAGVRRRKNVSETVEKFSIVKTLQAVEDANVVILLVDATEGMVDQDLHLLSYAIKKGRAIVIGVNKWDGLTAEHKQRVKDELDRRLRFIDFAEIHFISALHGSGVGKLYESIDAAYDAATQKLSTPRLTRILEDALADHPPPMVRGRRIKLRYAHAGGHNPPIIVIHGNQIDEIPGSYQRYLEKTFRRVLGLDGTPVKIEFRGSDNPYEAKRKKLTPRQERSRDKMMKRTGRSKK